MPAAKKSTPLHTTLLQGLDVKSRSDMTVHTIRVSGKTVAELCVGKSKTRLNFRNELPAPQRKLLSGKSKSWAGGLLVTDTNLNVARELLDLAVERAKSAQKVPVAA